MSAPQSSTSGSLTVIKPPTPIKISGKSVFLAGSIEMGNAPDWQTELTKLLENRLPDQHITVLNPRREDWNLESAQSIHTPKFKEHPRREDWNLESAQSIHNPEFKEQVDWELDAQDVVDVISLYFSPETKAPISLLELGLNAASHRMVVCCPDGYWRKGNVEIVCDRFKIPLCTTISELAEEVVKRLSA